MFEDAGTVSSGHPSTANETNRGERGCSLMQAPEGSDIFDERRIEVFVLNEVLMLSKAVFHDDVCGRAKENVVED